MRPKFRVGDRLVRIKNPSYSAIIAEVESNWYICDFYKDDKQSMYRELRTHDYIEEFYTLDLNHYIKSL